MLLVCSSHWIRQTVMTVAIPRREQFVTLRARRHRRRILDPPVKVDTPPRMPGMCASSKDHLTAPESVARLQV